MTKYEQELETFYR